MNVYIMPELVKPMSPKSSKYHGLTRAIFVFSLTLTYLNIHEYCLLKKTGPSQTNNIKYNSKNTIGSPNVAEPTPFKNDIHPNSRTQISILNGVVNKQTNVNNKCFNFTNSCRTFWFCKTNGPWQQITQNVILIKNCFDVKNKKNKMNPLITVRSNNCET